MLFFNNFKSYSDFVNLFWTRIISNVIALDKINNILANTKVSFIPDESITNIIWYINTLNVIVVIGSTLKSVRYVGVKFDITIDFLLNSKIKIITNTRNLVNAVPIAYASGVVLTSRWLSPEMSIKRPPNSNSEDIYITDNDIDIIIFTYCFDSYNWLNKNADISNPNAIRIPLKNKEIKMRKILIDIKNK